MVLGQPGWRTDIQRGIAMARSFDAATRIVTQLYRFSAPSRTVQHFPIRATCP